VSFPLQIVYREVEATTAIDELVRKHADKLSTFHDRIVHCRVFIELAHRHLRRGNRFQVKVQVTVPGGLVAVSSLSSAIDPEKLLEAGRKTKKMEIAAPEKELRQALADAFQSAGRRLQDLLRKQRSEVKSHRPPVARVAEIFPDRGYGFLETPDGRRIYFHRHSVLHGAFDRLIPGMTVTFAEEAGEQGPQASTVRAALPSTKPRRPSFVA
jgi:cold shock CspA family protein/ribosome-associated translation inhibitor RaiA